MPDTHNPDRTPDREQHHFSPSVPDLRPNLEEEKMFRSDRHGGMYSTRIVDNELGREATNLAGDVQSYEHKLYYERLRYQELEAKAEQLKRELLDLHVLRTGLEINEKEQLDKSIETILSMVDLQIRRQQVEITENEDRLKQALSKSEQHFRENEEAYKNQAVVDARRAGVDVNYPPYTDQEPSTSSNAE